MRFLNNIREVLEKNKRIQIMLVVVPLLLVIFYYMAYMYDLFKIYGVFANNDFLVSEDMKTNSLVEIKSIDKIDDNEYKLTLDSNLLFKPSVDTNGVIYGCYLTGDLEKPFKYFRPEVSIRTESDPFIVIDGFSNSGSTITYHTNEDYIKSEKTSSLKSSVEKLVYRLYLEKDGYRVVFYNKNEKEIFDKDIKKISNIKVNKDDSDLKDIYVYEFAEVKTDNNEFSLCTTLETNKDYYSKSQGVLLTNVSTDFWKNFVAESNMVVVIACLGGFLLLYSFCYKNREYEILSKKSLTWFTFVLFCIIPLLTFITYSLFGIRY